MTNILTFEDSLAKAQNDTKLHLLLGNGFSQACRPDVFSYGSLLERADFPSASPRLRRAFDALDTTDFEAVMRALRQATSLVKLYDPANRQLQQSFTDDATALRHLLADTIAKHHPELPSDIQESQYRSCRQFLSRFRTIYTLNYDLLLYWALMQTDSGPRVRYDDGFRTPQNGRCDYVTWEVEKTDTQNVFYLHGALHLFDAGETMQKYTWCNTGIRLIEQIRSALAQDLFPIIVAEGRSDQKLYRIHHNTYLARCYRSFAKIGGTLFILGHSMADADDHIVRLIEEGRLRQVFVGIYGDPSSGSNTRTVPRASRLNALRGELEVHLFDAGSANVWETLG